MAEMSGLDYLLKPIQLEKLKLAVSKAAQNIRNQSSQSGEQYSVLRDHLTNHTNKRLAVSLADEIVFLDINEIEYLEADGAYTKIFSKNNQSILASKNLNTFEQLLAGFPNFFRCHRSYLINMQAISRFVKTEGGSIITHGGKSLPVSQRSRESFFNLMRTFNLI
jgi:two-component system LytT family response regulator